MAGGAFPPKLRAVRDLLDLASERLGGSVLYANDDFFAEKENFLGGTVSVNVLCVPRALKREITGLPEILDPAHHPMRRPAT